MPSKSTTKDDTSDEQIAKLLAQDAKESSKRYSTQGVSAFLGQRSRNGAPKPNTRFLQHIIRDTDSHNAALKKKEQEEANYRLRHLSDSRGKEAESSRSGSKRKRLEEVKQHSDKRRRRSSSPDVRRRDKHGRNDDKRPHKSKRDGDREPTRRDRDRTCPKEKGGLDLTLENSRRKIFSTSGRVAKRKDRHRSPLVNSDSDHQIRDRRRRDKECHKRHRRRRSSSSSSSSSDISEPRQRKFTRKSQASRTTEFHAKPRLSSPSSSSTSDPLETIVGPLPPSSGRKHSQDQPTISRGRGAHRNLLSANIDSRFSSSYDPAQDLQPDSPPPTKGPKDSNGDWDMALEALHDRQKWRQVGADRLRNAGFGEDQVSRWEAEGETTREKGVEDVKWNGIGEEREWDRGKVVKKDKIEVQAAWAREGAAGDTKGKRKGKGGGLLGEMKRALGI